MRLLVTDTTINKEVPAGYTAICLALAYSRALQAFDQGKVVALQESGVTQVRRIYSEIVFRYLD